MILDKKTGRIAFHAIRLQENGPAKFVQYDFDGSILYEKDANNAIAEDFKQELK